MQVFLKQKVHLSRLSDTIHIQLKGTMWVFYDVAWLCYWPSVYWRLFVEAICTRNQFKQGISLKKDGAFLSMNDDLLKMSKIPTRLKLLIFDKRVHVYILMADVLLWYDSMPYSFKRNHTTTTFVPGFICTKQTKSELQLKGLWKEYLDQTLSSIVRITLRKMVGIFFLHQITNLGLIFK